MPLLTDFDGLDALLIGPAFLLWLTVGMWLVGDAGRLVRYTYGGVGGGLIAIGLFAHHGIERFLWMPVLTVGAGLAWLGLAHLATDYRDRRRAARAAADVRVRAATGEDT